jgi:transcription termination factor Rho
LNLSELEQKTISELHKIAKDLELTGCSRLRKKELIFEIMKANTEKDGLMFAQGILEILPDGYGFLRPFAYLPSHDDIYVSPSQIRRFDMRTGDRVAGQVRAPKETERFYALLRVETINGYDPDEASQRLHFDALTPIFPHAAPAQRDPRGGHAGRAWPYPYSCVEIFHPGRRLQSR